MAEPGLTVSPNPTPDPTPFETAKFFPGFMRAITISVVVIVLIGAALLALVDPDWLKMYSERHYTMATPGGTRKPPDTRMLAKFTALPTGWDGTPIPFFPGQSAPTRWTVNLATGAFIHVQTDIYLPDIIPINLSRTYSSFDYAERDFGIGSSDSYEIYLVGDNSVYSYIDMMFPDGWIVHMPRISPGTSYDATYEHRAAPGDPADIFDKARLWWHSPWYFSSLKDGTGIVFPASRWAQQWGQRAAIMIQDAKDNVEDIKRDEAGNIVEITSPNGQKLVLTPDKDHRIIGAAGSNGYSIYYTYDESGRLTGVTDSKGNVTGYTYDIDNNMLTIKQPDGRIWLTNNYDKRHRVIGQTFLNGTQASYKYTTADPQARTITEVTHPDKSIDTYSFNRQGSLTSRTHQPSPTLGSPPP
jgi:YD repeat-containing protein